MNKHHSHCSWLSKLKLRRLSHNQDGEAVVSFALVLPILLLTSFAILEFALLMMDRQQASEALRRFSRVVAITMSVDDLAHINPNSSTSCSYSDAQVSCDNGTNITNWTKLIAGFQDAQDVFPNLQSSNVVLVFEPSGLEPDDADMGTMALVTVQFQNLQYDSIILPRYGTFVANIFFPTMSHSLVLGG